MLRGVLFALVTFGFVLLWLVDVARTPGDEVRSLTKAAWLALVLLLPVIGALAWLVAGRPSEAPARPPRWRVPRPRRPLGWRGPQRWRASHGRRGPQRLRLSPQDALRRHPSAQAADDAGHGTLAGAAGYLAPGRVGRPAGPDDDPEFLAEIERRIREARDGR